MPYKSFSERYSYDQVKKSSFIYGEDFQSPGGEKFARQEAQKIKIEENSSIFILGSGLGGHGFLYAETSGYFHTNFTPTRSLKTCYFAVLK